MDLRVIRARLAPLLLVLAAAVACSPVSETGGDALVQVTLLAAPACPDEPREPDASDCADRPLADTGVQIMSEGDVVTRARTRDDGQVTVVVPPGTYTVQVDRLPGLVVDPDPVTVEASAGETTAVTIAVDTGVREDAAGAP